MESDDIMSEPYVRDIFTRSLRPNLASHAPNVNIMILIVGNISDEDDISIGTNNTVLSIIPSKHNRLIRKWDC